MSGVWSLQEGFGEIPQTIPGKTDNDAFFRYQTNVGRTDLKFKLSKKFAYEADDDNQHLKMQMLSALRMQVVKSS